MIAATGVAGAPARSRATCGRARSHGGADRGCARRQRRAECETVCASTASASPYRYFWKAKYGGPEVSDPRRQKRLEDENRRLKTLVAAARSTIRCSHQVSS